MILILYNIDKEISKTVTDNMDKYEWIGDFQNAFGKLPRIK